MFSIMDIVSSMTINQMSKKIVGYLVLSSIPVVWNLMLSLLAGKKIKKVKVLDKNRLRTDYKKKSIIYYIIICIITMLNIIEREYYFIALNTLIVTIIAIIDIIKEKKDEIAIECKNGIIYRDTLYLWKNVICHRETDQFKEISLKKNDLYYFKEET